MNKSLKVIPSADRDGCCYALVTLTGGGWCVQNVFEFGPIKPGVLEVYYVDNRP